MTHHWVYLITNLVNGKIYVGKHSGKSLQAYLRHGYRHAVTGHNGRTYLSNAFKRYGEDAFTIEPLVEVPDFLGDDLIDHQLNELEIFFIRTFNSRDSDIGYNLTVGGEGTRGITFKHTEEWKRQTSLRNKGRKVTWADKISAAQKGAIRPESWRQALKGSHGGPHKKKRSAEHGQKITENKKQWWATVSPEKRALVIARIKEGQRKAREAKNGPTTA